MISWKNKLNEKCIELNIEPVIEDYSVTLYCSDIPKKKEDIIKDIPNSYTYKFIETIKPTTIKVINVNASMMSLMGNIKVENKKVILKFKTISPDIEIKENIWNIFSTFIEEDGYADIWEITINDHTEIYNLKIAKIIEENKIRDTFINNEDIMNLIISLNSSKSIDELLTKV